ncbi:MAG TPA: response regulator transcription factor [Bryobacteraceae bacterium]|nr:response regulator transcription factor [Bryobacteraceae bacterium]
MNPQEKILIVDGNTAERRALHGDLLDAGFEVADAESPEQGVALARVTAFDLVLVHLPVLELGVKICGTLRSEIPRAAMVVLADYDDPNRKAEMLEGGADQCLVKPLHQPEFIARIRAALRRARNSTNQSNAAITIGGIRLDPGQRLAYRDGVPVRLTPKEFTLLYHLMSHAGLPMAHEALLKAVWGEDHIGRVEYLRIFMRQLRTKLNDHINPQYLLTDSCIGYHFVEADKAPSLSRPAI